MPISDVFRSLPRLRTKRLLLRPVQYDDAPAIFGYASDPHVTRYTLFETHTSLADARAFVGQVMESYVNGGSGVWAIELSASGCLIGTGGFGRIDERHRHAEIGYSLSRPHWNHGYATEAVQEMIRFGFESMGLIRIEARTHPENLASIRVLQKAGMIQEGRLRSAYVVQGVTTDALVYGIIADPSGRTVDIETGRRARAAR